MEKTSYQCYVYESVGAYLRLYFKNGRETEVRGSRVSIVKHSMLISKLTGGWGCIRTRLCQPFYSALFSILIPVSYVSQYVFLCFRTSSVIPLITEKTMETNVYRKSDWLRLTARIFVPPSHMDYQQKECVHTQITVELDWTQARINARRLQ